MDGHDHHEHQQQYKEAREKLGEAIKEFCNVTDPTNHLLLGATVVFETTCFDEEGYQTYYVGNVIIEPSSLAHALGLVTSAKDRLTTYINKPIQED